MKNKRFYLNIYRKRLHQLNEVNSELNELNRDLYEQTLKAIDDLLIDAIDFDEKYIAILKDIARYRPRNYLNDDDISKLQLAHEFYDGDGRFGGGSNE